MLRPPVPTRRERILAMGSFGTGKTTAWLTIAQWAHVTGSDAQFYVIDTDAAVAHMIESHPARERIHVHHAFEWTEYEEGIERYLPALRPQDWLVVDFVGTAWEAVQDWYVAQIYKTSIDDFFVEARQSAKSGNPLDGWKDWSVINRVYKSWINRVIFRNPAQVFLTAQAEGVRDTDDRSVKQIYGKVGMRPRGQKALGHQVHSILLFSALRPSEVTLTTVKDRERRVVESERLNDFTVEYLMGVAGWEM